MKLKTIISFIAVTVLLSSCLPEADASGKLGILRLVKAGIILKALTHKKFIPIPIPIPIGIHKDHHHEGHHGGYGGGYGHHGFEDYHHGGYGGGYGHHGFEDYHHHEPHYGHGHKVYSTGWRLEGIGKWH